MTFGPKYLTLPLIGMALWLSAPTTAHANLKDCGGVFISGDADCEYRKTEECMTECTTESVQTSCAAKIYTSCEQECTASASASCETSCSEVCTSDCEEMVDDEEPANCMGLCAADCQESCNSDDTCGQKNKGPCRSCCSHTCNDKCEARCKDEPEPADKPESCMPTCTTACSGSCTAQANVECQVDCQTDVYTECETELVKTCKTECEDKGGAIFCDGQFLNAVEAKSCAAELKAKFSISVTVDDVQDGVSNVTDNGKKKAKSICSVGDVGMNGGSSGMAALFGLGLCALPFARKRR